MQTYLHQRATRDESGCLDAACKEAGVAFHFAKHTRLVTLENLVATCKVFLKELPRVKPFEHVEEQKLDTVDTGGVTQNEGIYWESMRNCLLPLPPYHQIRRFNHQTVSKHDVRKPMPLIPSRSPKSGFCEQVRLSNEGNVVTKVTYRIGPVRKQ